MSNALCALCEVLCCKHIHLKGKHKGSQIIDDIEYHQKRCCLCLAQAANVNCICSKIKVCVITQHMEYGKQQANRIVSQNEKRAYRQYICFVDNTITQWKSSYSCLTTISCLLCETKNTVMCGWIYILPLIKLIKLYSNAYSHMEFFPISSRSLNLD